MSSTPDPALLARFGAGAPEFVAQTPIATVWKVRLEDGRLAALKCYTGGMKNEAAGIDLLQALDGAGAARIYGRADGAVLLEWLDGPSLGDLSRGGEDRRANIELVEVARRLHGGPDPAGLSLPTLDRWFGSLFSLGFAPDCPAPARRDIDRARHIARELLATQTDIRALHGDLHHDNIRHSPRGYLAFDAKGVRGDRGYELANAFRNPVGVPDLVRSPARIADIAALWSDRFDIPQGRLLSWAAAKCALSIAWRAGGVLEEDADLGLLATLVGMSPAKPG